MAARGGYSSGVCFSARFLRPSFGLRPFGGRRAPKPPRSTQRSRMRLCNPCARLRRTHYTTFVLQMATRSLHAMPSCGCSDADERRSSESGKVAGCEVMRCSHSMPSLSNACIMNDDLTRFLYHGTLRRNVPSIRATGLQPQRGAWAGRFHHDAADLVYAVDDQHPASALLAIVGQMTKAGLAQRSENYSFDDFRNDLIEHGTVLVVKDTTFRHHPWTFETSGHPMGTEQGNWYSSEPVSIESEVIGKDMLALLKPNEQEFILGRYRVSW
jgi:hypothetical protein